MLASISLFVNLFVALFTDIFAELSQGKTDRTLSFSTRFQKDLWGAEPTTDNDQPSEPSKPNELNKPDEPSKTDKSRKPDKPDKIDKVDKKGEKKSYKATKRAFMNRQHLLLQDLQLERLHFAAPVTTEINLGHNAILFVLEDDELPLVELNLYFSGGTDSEPIGRAGRLQAALQLMEKGGAGNRDAEQFAAALSRLGIKLNFFANYESWGVSLITLKQNFDAAFALLKDALLQPRLPQEELARIKRQMLAKITARNENPARIAHRKLSELLYPQLRLGHSLQKENIKKLNRQDIELEIKRRLQFDTTYVTVGGDIQKLNIQVKLKELFSQIAQMAAAPSATATTLSQATANSSNSVEMVLPELLRQQNRRYSEKIVLVKTAASQTAIAIGGYLPPHNHPDFYALQAGNYILGGGSFVSRLTREIRTKRGLAYYAYSYNLFGANYGRFIASCGTRSDAVHESLALMLREIKGITSIKMEELQLAKEAILNSLIFQFDTSAKILSQKVRFRLHQMPSDYLQQLPQKIDLLRIADLRKMEDYLQIKKLYIVVAGPESLQAKLEQIRPVVVIEPEEKLF